MNKTNCYIWTIIIVIQLFAAIFLTNFYSWVFFAICSIFVLFFEKYEKISIMLWCLFLIGIITYFLNNIEISNNLFNLLFFYLLFFAIKNLITKK